MKKGTIVYNSYRGLDRYGVVLSGNTEKDGWKYVKVKWFDDEPYRRSVKWRKKLDGKDHTLKEYRIDQVSALDADRVISALQKAKQFAKAELGA
jgi:hypothetical protein